MTLTAGLQCKATSAPSPPDRLSPLPLHLYLETTRCCPCRMWPPVTPMVGLQREATAPATLGGHPLPRGAKVFINVQSIHHDPRHYPEPEVRAFSWMSQHTRAT